MRMAFSFFNLVAPLPRPPPPSPNFTSSSFVLGHNIPPTNTQLSKIFLFSTSRYLFSSAATPPQGPTEGQEIGQEVAAAPSFSRSSSSSARSQIDLLDQLSSSRSANNGYESSQKPTIQQQLANLVAGRDDDFTIPLGKNLKNVSAAFLTISQRRNIKRQTYLNEVSQRNDSVFFATIGAFILLPPIVILGIAIATGYVQLFP